MIGKIIDFNIHTKVGYIIADSKRFFVTAQSFPVEQRKSIIDGRMVNFEVTHSKKLGLHAVNARLISKSTNKPKRSDSINSI